MTKTTDEEDTAELAEETVLPPEDSVEDTAPEEEDISEEKTVSKKVQAWQAKNLLASYLEEVRILKEFNYLDDGENHKQRLELFQKLKQKEKLLEKQHVKPPKPEPVLKPVLKTHTATSVSSSKPSVIPPKTEPKASTGAKTKAKITATKPAKKAVMPKASKPGKLKLAAKKPKKPVKPIKSAKPSKKAHKKPKK